MQADLTGLRVAVLAADGFEQVELTVPVDALEDAGAEVEIVSVRPGRIRGMNHLYPGKKVKVDRLVGVVDAVDYDALLLPGGLANPDTLRQSDEALDFVRAFDRAGKPIAVICHGPWVLASAGLVVRRKMTSWPGIRDDLRNAGAIWTDEPLVRDRNWISSRGPHDLPQFVSAMLDLFGEVVPTSLLETVDQRHEEEEDHGGVGLPALGIVAGGLLAAALGYAVTRARRSERAGEVPASAEGGVEIVVVEEEEYEPEFGRDFAGGMPYAAGSDYTGPVGTDVRSRGV